MILTFPNGQEVDVQFDDKTHSYQVAHKINGEFTDYRPTHGITAPLSVVPKPFLTPWGAKVGVEALLEYQLTNELPDLEQFFIDKKAYETNERTEDGKPVMSYYKFAKAYPWFSKVKGAYKQKSKEGQEIGTWLHSAIENFYKSDRKTKPVITDEETQKLWDSFTMFDNFFKPKADAEGLEFLVYSLMFGFSGQGDFRGVMSGKKCIGDWKTTNRSDQNTDGISTEYFFQLGGLAQAEFERTGEWVDDLFAANFDKEGGEPRVVWASEFGMSPQDCARAYVNCFNTYHMIETWDYKFKKR
ncbi:pddexK-like domain of unknown function [Caudoviricetes sp.]|nr:pddexK-like domain of unknown function [Caudoviricetes sp.]